MSTETIAPIEPYLNPVYWDGHTLQDGLAQRLEVDHITRSMRHFAVESLATTLTARDRQFVLSVYRHGSRLLAAEREIGTLVFMNRETLMQERSDVPLEPMETYVNPAVPVVPTNVDLNFADHTQDRFGSHYRVGAGYVYESMARCGVIVPDRKGQHMLLSVTGGGIWHGADPRQVKDWSISKKFTNEGAELKVGEVMHLPSSFSVPERLTRINVIEVRALGKPERAYKTLRERAKDLYRLRFGSTEPITLDPISD